MRWGWALLVLASACDAGATVVVQMRTDLLPQREPTAVEVLFGLSTEQLDASDARDWVRGVRVAERTGGPR